MLQPGLHIRHPESNESTRRGPRFRHAGSLSHPAPPGCHPVPGQHNCPRLVSYGHGPVGRYRLPHKHLKQNERLNLFPFLRGGEQLAVFRFRGTRTHEEFVPMPFGQSTNGRKQSDGLDQFKTNYRSKLVQQRSNAGQNASGVFWTSDKVRMGT